MSGLKREGPLKAEGDRMQFETFADRRVSGMILCPMKLAHIAIMRCAEHQQTLKCTCPAKASGYLIRQKRKAKARICRLSLNKKRPVVHGMHE